MRQRQTTWPPSLSWWRYNRNLRETQEIETCHLVFGDQKRLADGHSVDRAFIPAAFVGTHLKSAGRDLYEFHPKRIGDPVCVDRSGKRIRN